MCNLISSAWLYPYLCACLLNVFIPHACKRYQCWGESVCSCLQMPCRTHGSPHKHWMDGWTVRQMSEQMDEAQDMTYRGSWWGLPGQGYFPAPHSAGWHSDLILDGLEEEVILSTQVHTESQPLLYLGLRNPQISRLQVIKLIFWRAITARNQTDMPHLHSTSGLHRQNWTQPVEFLLLNVSHRSPAGSSQPGQPQEKVLRDSSPRYGKLFS